MSSKALKTIFWVALFSIAMGYMESAIVVYLRKLYYPGGFTFPLSNIEIDIAGVEFVRELATMIMLATIGIVAGRKNIERFAYFIFSFAIWDIFYYVFLKILVQWPESLMTWDVLFLIPVTWFGPVIGPVLNSITMILLAVVTIYFVDKNQKAKYGWLVWTLLIVGSLVVIVSYTEEYTRFMMQEFTFWELIGIRDAESIIALALTYIPQKFNWYIFLVGEVMHLAAIGLVVVRNKKLS
ncbi:MAG: hypothetical protein K9J13_06350 [Saprospiraceae bacterium]|nr:hypothetical protein [Saprospiraceae bacterium]